MKASPIRLAGGIELAALPGGALLWPAEDCLIVADLHLETGRAYARRGVPLPPYDTDQTLERLEGLIALHRPARVVSLGDAFHDPDGADGLAAQARARLRRLVACCEWLWIAGNHDPRPPKGLGGCALSELRRGGLVLRHVPAAGAIEGAEIAGHLHPKARLRTGGRALSRRCFVSDPSRVLLPAFGSYTGGLSVSAPAVRACFPGAFTAHLLGEARIHPFPHHRLDP